MIPKFTQLSQSLVAGGWSIELHKLAGRSGTATAAFLIAEPDSWEGACQLTGQVLALPQC